MPGLGYQVLTAWHGLCWYAGMARDNSPSMLAAGGRGRARTRMAKEINSNLKRLAELILKPTPMAQRDWLPGDHAALLVLRIREELEATKPADFKGDAKAWRAACFDAAIAAVDGGCWLYASNAKKELAEAGIIPSKPEVAADRYAHLK